MNELRAREEICRIGRSLFERGLVHATAGNISIRLGEADGGAFLITPTDACLGFLDPARLAKLDAGLRQLSGDPASKTIALHAGIYRAATAYDPDTRCIIHTHSTHCVALSIAHASNELLPPITPYFVMKVGHVPVIPYHRPGAPATADLVTNTIHAYGRRGTPLRAVMLERLGPNVWHDSPAAAMSVLEELEETARLMFLVDAPTALGELPIQELRETFGARW